MMVRAGGEDKTSDASAASLSPVSFGRRTGERPHPARHGHRAREAQARLDAHGPGALVVARLVPAGRVSALAACLLSGWPLRRFALADLPAALIWAVVFVAVGVVGGALFPKPWEGILAAVTAVLLAGAVPMLWRRLRGGRDRSLPGGTGARIGGDREAEDRPVRGSRSGS